MDNRFTRFRVALALAGIKAAELARRMKTSESHLLRTAKSHRLPNGKVYQSPGLLLRVDDFIREQYQDMAHLLTVPEAPAPEAGNQTKQGDAT